MLSFCIIIPQHNRADKTLSALFEGIYSRSQIQKGFTNNQIKILRAEEKTYKIHPEKYYLKRWDIVEMDIKPIPSTLPPDYRPLEIVYENKNFVVVNKDAGINTHPTPGWNGQSGTLVNQLIAQIDDFDREEGEERPGIVHRLDKNTSGLLIVAKNDITLRKLQKLIHDHKVKKTYLALVVWVPKNSSGTIQSFIWRDKNDRMKMTVKNPLQPREAITHYEIKETFSFQKKKFSLVEVTLETWRTHQIRVHMANISHPILGDSTYGDPTLNDWGKEHLGIKRQFLHAWKLEFELDKKKYDFESYLKNDLKKAIEQLENSKVKLP